MTITDKLEILGEISERARQLEAGPHPAVDGTGRPGDGPLADWEHRVAADQAAAGMLTWRVELLDAIYQTLAREEWPRLREAIINVAAECVVWILNGDGRDVAAAPTGSGQAT